MSKKIHVVPQVLSHFNRVSSCLGPQGTSRNVKEAKLSRPKCCYLNCNRRWFEMIYDHTRVYIVYHLFEHRWRSRDIYIYQFGFVRVALYTAVVLDSTGFQGSQVGWTLDSWKLQERRSDIHWPTRNMLQLLWVFVQRFCRSEGLKGQMWLLAHPLCWYLCCSFRWPLLINPCYESLIILIPTQSWVLYDCLQVFKSIAHKAVMAVYIFFCLHW